jgi:hypothetical protein
VRKCLTALLLLAAFAWAAPRVCAQEQPAEIPKITIDAADQDLGQLLAQFRALTGADIRLGWDAAGAPLAEAAEPIRVTIALNDLAWQDALYRVARAADCRVDRDGETWILSRGPAKTHQTVIGARPSEQEKELHVVRAHEVRRATQEIAIPFYVALVYLGSVLALWAWQCLALILIPRVVEASRSASERRPLLAPAIGAPNGLGLMLVGGAASQAGAPGALFAMLCFSVLLVLLAIGFAGKAEAMGRRLLDGSDRTPSRFAHLSAGWGVIAGVALVPVFGWVVLGWWALGAVGSATLGLLGAVARRPGGGSGGGPAMPAPAARA